MSINIINLDYRNNDNYETVPAFVGGTGTQVYSAAGYYEWTVPAGITVVRAKLWGAAGGSLAGSGGGGGAFAQGDFAVQPQDVILITVGAGGTFLTNMRNRASTLALMGGVPGIDGDGRPFGGFGGGLVSLSRRTESGDVDLLLVAGSGGGTPSAPGVGLSGGSLDGSQTAGGLPGDSTAGGGTYLRGGAGASSPSTNNGGSGGGAGYFGGAGGVNGGQAGGGSSYAHPTQTANTVLIAASGVSPANSGDADYGGNAGLGVNNADGNPGRIVLLY